MPGGGVSLVRVADSLRTRGVEAINTDQRTGVKIALTAMEAPFRRIVANAGVEPSVVLAQVRSGKDAQGYNAQTGEYGDMLKMGIIDPAKVTRTALQNAASIAGLMLTTEVMITELPRDSKEQPAMPDMGEW